MTRDSLATKKFKEFITIAPLSHALWRTVEALAFQETKFRKPVLDLGCGFGEFAGVVFGKIEMGIDINKRDLKVAATKKRYSRLILADARKLPFPDGKFNTVVSVSVLEHMVGVQFALKEASRVLKKNGLFIITVPTTSLGKNSIVSRVFSPLGLDWLASWYINKHRQFFAHQIWESRLWWEQSLRKSGFKILVSHGTISAQCLWLHELFLLSAIPSQVGKWLFGKRIIVLRRFRQWLLPVLFRRFLYVDRESAINLFIVAQKHEAKV